MSKLKQVRRAALVSLASACASTTAPIARVTAVEPVELRADVGSRGQVAAGDAPQVASDDRARRAAATEPGPPRALLVVSVPGDRSGALDEPALERIAAQLGRAVERTGFVAVAPEASPTAAELDARGQNAFALAVVVERFAGGECRIEIRVAPWRGRDGGERWDTGRTALVRATARVVGRVTRTSARDCVEAALEDATARQVVRFLDHIARAP